MGMPTPGADDDLPVAQADDVVRLIDDEIAHTHDTLGAIEHLQEILSTQSIVLPGAPIRKVHRTISWDDASPAFGDSEGPEPTFSAWIAPAAARNAIQPVEQPISAELDVLDALPESDVADTEGNPGGEDEDDSIVDDSGLIAPRPTPRIPEWQGVLGDPEPLRRSALSIEEIGLEPTPADYRAGRATRMFWLWFPAVASAITVALGAVLIQLGMNLAQATVATLLGLALSFLPLGFGTLAGKHTGQPPIVVSRAMFGTVGNLIPASLALLTRLFWGAIVLWLLAASTQSIARTAQWRGVSGQVLWISFAVGAAAAIAVAVFGYWLIARVQLVLTICSAVLVLWLIVQTAPSVDFAAAFARPPGGGELIATGAVLVFSVIGLSWAQASGDLARYQRPRASSAGSMGWATLGAAVPAFVLIGYGTMLAASSPLLARNLLADPIAAIAGESQVTWYPIPLLAAVGLNLVSALVLNLYSGAFALRAIGAPVRRWVAVLAVGLATVAIAAILVGTIGSAGPLVLDAATTLAVPIAAWTGIFSVEVMLRRARFDADAFRRGGIYPTFRPANLIMLGVATLVGLGLMSARLGWLSWEGYFYRMVGIDPFGPLGSADLGVLVALVLGLLTPVVTSMRNIRRSTTT